MQKKFIFLFFIALLIIGCKKTSSFKFALLSDTHIIENSDANEDLKMVVNDVNNNSDIKFTLVSGDITEINTGDNLKIAKQILDKLNNPYYIIPGNHDTKWSGSAGANFRALWGDDKFIFDYNGFRFIGFHQGPVLRMDDGHISLETLNWLKNTLHNTGKKTPVFLIMHYPLNSSIDNWFECINLIRDYNIKAIFHGHGHRNRLEMYNNIPGIMGRSTLGANSSSPGYTIVELRNDSLLMSEKKTESALLNHWSSISLKDNKEIEAVADSLLPDYSINQKYPEVKLKWVYNSGYTMTASPVGDAENVYIGDVSGSITALNRKNGIKLWNYEAGEAIYGTVALYKNSIVFTSADSFIYCIDKNEGKLVWKVKTGNALVSVPLIEDGIVYVGSSDGVFRALNLGSGEIIWSYTGIKGYVETKPLVYKNKVIFGAWDSQLYALDKYSGKLSWSWEGPFKHSLYSPAACWPVAANDKVFIVAPDRNVTALDEKTGKTIWRNYQWKFRETIGISNDGNYIFARSMTDSVVAFQSSGSKAKVKWAKDFGYGYDIAPSMPMEKDGTLFWGTKNGLIIAAESKSGKLKWKYKFQNYLINTVYPVNSNNILFSNIDGNVALLISQK